MQNTSPSHAVHNLCARPLSAREMKRAWSACVLDRWELHSVGKRSGMGFYGASGGLRTGSYCWADSDSTKPQLNMLCYDDRSRPWSTIGVQGSRALLRCCVAWSEQPKVLVANLWSRWTGEWRKFETKGSCISLTQPVLAPPHGARSALFQNKRRGVLLLNSSRGFQCRAR